MLIKTFPSKALLRNFSRLAAQVTIPWCRFSSRCRMFPVGELGLAGSKFRQFREPVVPLRNSICRSFCWKEKQLYELASSTTPTCSSALKLKQLGAGILHSYRQRLPNWISRYVSCRFSLQKNGRGHWSNGTHRRPSIHAICVRFSSSSNRSIGHLRQLLSIFRRSRSRTASSIIGRIRSRIFFVDRELDA